DWMLAVHARNREAAAGYKVDTDRQSPRLRIEVGAGHEPRRADSQRRLEQLFGHQEQPRGLRRKHPSVPTQISTEAFFSAGQVRLRQCSIAAASRSKARRSGFW